MRSAIRRRLVRLESVNVIGVRYVVSDQPYDDDYQQVGSLSLSPPPTVEQWERTFCHHEEAARRSVE